MAIIQREDGVQLVLRCYRETLSLSNTTLFRQHAFLISEMHGYFVKFFSRGGKQIESVFSSDAGYVFAEMIWNHFNKPANMIFCEALSNQNFVCVTIRDGVIFSDGEFNAEELREELASTLSMQSNTEIYLYGDIPGFSKSEDQDKQLFSQHSFKNITWLEQSLINTIEALPEFELTPLQQAVNDLQLSKASQRKAFWLATLAIGIIAIVITYFVLFMTTKQATQQVDPYEGFHNALRTPSPKAELQQAIDGALLIGSIPGWQLNQAEIKNSQLTGTLSSYGGSATSLLNWAKTYRASILFEQSGTKIILPLGGLTNRNPPMRPVALTQTTATIIDSLMQVMPQKSLNLSSISRRGVYNTLDGTIQFRSLTPSIISLIGSMLNSLPINVDSITLTRADNFINGDIKLTVLGN